MSKRQDRRDPRKEDFWNKIVREQSGSGLSVRAFCRRRRISEASFYAWRRELMMRQLEGRTGRGRPAASKPTFVPVTLADVAAGVELVLPSGVVVRLPAATEWAAVATLVADLERRAC